MAVALAAAAGIAAGAAGLAVIGGSVEPGVRGGNAGDQVESVLPGSAPWHAGVRAGQEIVAVSAADDPSGWSIETVSEGGRITSSLAGAMARLRQSWPVAGAAILSVAIGLAICRLRPRWSVGVSCLAAALASQPLLVQADPVTSSYGALLALATPPVLLGMWKPRWWLARAAAVGTACAGAAWLATRLIGLESFDPLETVRSAGVVAGNLALTGAFVLMVSRRLRATAEGRRWLIDLTGLLVAVIVAGALLLTETPLPILAAVGVVLVVLYPFVRRWAAGILDRLLLAGVRERLSIAGAEAERARLARDLHDAPLQDLAGIIKRLEVLPDARAESDALRDVARELRSVATQLYPPALHDLGLVAAIEQSVERSRDRHPDVEVVVELTDHTGIRRDDRPPEAVELAAFRIGHEALANALAHSQARLVHVSGVLRPTQVVLSIRDDGRGMPAGADRRALETGHFGLQSMRRRAEAIGAQLDVRTSGDGTEIRLRWDA